MGLRERKKQETRAALSWAAVKLAVERGGVDNVLVEEIAAAAGVSPRTFNNYFSSKGEAIAARQLDRWLRMAETLRERPAGEPLWDSLTHAALAQLEPGPEMQGQMGQDRDKWVAGVRVMVAEPSLQAEMLRAGALAQSVLAAAVADRVGSSADDLYPNLVAGAVLAAINVASQRWLGSGANSDIRALTAEAMHRLAAGLPPP